ncbi:single-stranded-DNA-specific exonuclease RecJ [Leptodesmis sp.]|uniref:single-stranded-DNA-specific exonuclease RecJ n=1 Tax=Leptodesmis sp. TaxID=3100501 RepID=UPI0040535109
MPELPVQWQLQSIDQPPEAFIQTLRSCIACNSGKYLAQLLWQRGMRQPEQLQGYLHAEDYQPTSPFAFGQEMELAVERLQRARDNAEIVAIWGDFDADGVTATAVLWDGLGQFFTQQKTLFYYIPNRLTESHGLSQAGIDVLHSKGCQLMVTCDTGSTNLTEIEYAQGLGIDVIVTDHHTLPLSRPPVTAILNPRSLAADHPLATLSGVAVAYKLVEALYSILPHVPQKPLQELLDLVAIGLIADLVELKGDCRYLAQIGIQQLQKQANPATATRPGVAKLLEFCKRSGDRPTDISFGIGPRINAVSRIQGDAHFCVELLTSQDKHRCSHLAEATELANTRRKALQKEVVQQVINRLAQVDLSTTSVIVLADEQWQPGVLGLVAGQIAQEYGRPTILLSLERWRSGEWGVGSGNWGGSREDQGDGEDEGEIQKFTFSSTPPPLLARGSARSLNNIDLYQLIQGQEHLLHRFGGHPYAAGLSLPVENLPLFTEAINQRLRQLSDSTGVGPSLIIDLVVTVKELGKELFQELKWLEPCGMGNPTPRLLIRDCWFEKVWNQKIRDCTGRKVEYIKTEFELWDSSVTKGFPGVWWGHYREDIPAGRCDAVVELDFNTYANESKGIKPHYEVRLIAVRPAETDGLAPAIAPHSMLLDWRRTALANAPTGLNPLIMTQCPHSWTELQLWFRRAEQSQRPLAIAYPAPTLTPPMDIWRRLVGIAKYLSRTAQTATRQQLLDKLEIGDRALQLGFQTLTQLGFTVTHPETGFQITWQPAELTSDQNLAEAVEQFLLAVKEDQFRRQYFYQTPVETLREMVEAKVVIC